MDHSNASLEEKIDTLTKIILGVNTKVIEATKKIDENFEILDNKIDALQSQLDGLHIESKTGFADVKHELKKIQKVSNYSEEYENLLKIAK
ncbi:hypothetical protein [Flavobacterium aquicola]|uniref:Uncharacterized protein n=1 Tax=Flavobacterium aquicola TaxID=1682742 RepID=A0A3E0E6W0_9FLAO|nr:hypothetical protein [Flavobacterium aquicola]REG93009.1 hypothetical protein C8P67_114110 [Flavobacterium aquicola]